MTQPNEAELNASKARLLAQTGMTPEQVKALAEAGKQTEAEKEKEARLTASLANVAEAEEKAATGEDLEFDIDAYIKEGIVVKKNVPLDDKTYIDIQTLTQKQLMLAEAMVKAEFGHMPEDKVYEHALSTAMLSLAITRFNNQRFEMPDVTAAAPKDKGMAEAQATLLERKTYLFKKLLGAGEDFLRALRILYKNLALADLLEEAVQKK